MTGAYLRVPRDGKYQNIEVEHLTDEERAVLLSRDPESILLWLNLVCKTLAGAEKLFKELETDGVLTRATDESTDESTDD